MDIDISTNGTEARVVLSGSLNTTTAPELERALTPLFGTADSLTFDFSELEYISSAGLRVMMVAYKGLNQRGVAIEGANDEAREVFDITGFSALFDVR